MENVYNIIDTCINGVICIHSLFIINEIFRFIQNVYNNTNTLQILFYLSSFTNYMYDKIDIYTPNIVKEYAKYAAYYIQYFSASYSGYSIEPLTTSWICLYWTSYQPSSNNENILTANVYEYNDIYHFFSFTQKNLLKNIKIFMHIITPPFLTNEVVITIAEKDKRITRILYQSPSNICSTCRVPPIQPNNEDTIDFFQIFQITKKAYFKLANLVSIYFSQKSIQSHIKFLAVSYTHPSMKHKIIDLVIPYNDFCENNEILSYTYIMRLLEHQPDQDYVFDADYVIKIIDNNIQEVELTSNQYIQLSTDSYKIITPVGQTDKQE